MSPIVFTCLVCSSAALETERAKPRMTVRTRSKRPAIFAFVFVNQHIINAGNAPAHQAMFVEFPVLIAVLRSCELLGTSEA